MTSDHKHLVVIAGPTASGKTALGVRLAQHFQTEIISADSRQIFREMKIGTAVPDDAELDAVRHHFIQTQSLDSYYNASMFERDVLQTLGNLFRKYDIVLMVGGSGLYIDAVCSGIDDLPAVDPEIRQELAGRYAQEGLKSLQEELKTLDPASYDRIDLNNHLRVLKALEISIQTGRPYSEYLTHSMKKRDFRITRIALDVEREVLYARINKRVDEMVAGGLIREAEELMAFRGANALKTVGYREIFEFLDGRISKEEAIEKIRNNTRKYARKQITWFRKNGLYRWMDPSDPGEIIRHIEAQTGVGGP